uniref:MHC class II antigen n=3 Tax=Salmo salar TaxID=8030 RepID=V9NC01_SALSA|nr:MHC class II antigen [Salmo salar]AGL08660.1 MHC class II antigen [Salmo salar]
MGCRVFLAFILGVCLLSHCQSKHLLRFLTFCQKNVPSDEEYDVEFDGDELFYVDSITYQVERRLSEFAQQWTPDPGLPHEVYVSLGTCQYNIPRCIVGEKSPPEAIEVEVHTDHQTVETAVCVGGVTLGVVGVATGVWFIKKAKRSGWALRT